MKNTFGNLATRWRTTAQISIFIWAAIVSQSCATNSPSEMTLQEMLSQPECNSSCWNGIEPEITTYDELVDLLDESNVDYITFTVLEDESFSWCLSADNPLSRSEESATVTIATSSSEGMVGYVLVSNVDLCVSTVIQEYGLPDRLVEVSSYTYVLLYPEQQLSFHTDRDLRYVRSLYMRVKEVIEEQFTTYPSIQDEAEIRGLVSEDCKDAFASSR